MSGLRTFRDAVCVVTGGASGIGRALGEALALQEGAELVLADLQFELAEAAAAEIVAKGGRARAVRVDVTDADACRSLVAEVMDSTKRIDFMFNNAGIAIGGEAQLNSVADWDKVVDVNLKGVIYGIQAVYPVMIAQGFGHIVNTASIAGLLPMPLAASYNATKHAVVGLSKGLRVEAAARGVRVSVVCPGAIETPILSGGVHGKLLGFDGQTALRSWAKLGALGPIPPARFVKKILPRIRKNHELIVEPGMWRLVTVLYRLFPGITNVLVRKGFRDLQQEIALKGQDDAAHD